MRSMTSTTTLWHRTSRCRSRGSARTIWSFGIIWGFSRLTSRKRNNPQRSCSRRPKVRCMWSSEHLRGDPSRDATVPLHLGQKAPNPPGAAHGTPMREHLCCDPPRDATVALHLSQTGPDPPRAARGTPMRERSRSVVLVQCPLSVVDSTV